jgi:GH24 family phage-related lysozyme (muramidase)
MSDQPWRLWVPFWEKDFLLLRSVEDMKYSDPRLLVSKPKWLKQANPDIQRHEGFRAYAYPDPLSKLGKKYKDPKYRWGFEPGDMLLAKYGESERDGRPWTVGYGFTKGVTPSTQMPKPIADARLEDIIIEHANGLDTLAPGWENIPAFAVSVLVDLIYNLGLERFSKFKPTIDLIMKGRYSEAAQHLRKTPWFLQTGARAEEMVTRLEKQAIEPAHLYKV